MPDTELSILNEIYDVILDRKNNPVDGSYVCSLLNHRKGMDKILEKVGEEAVEVILAAKNKDHDEIIYESSDLIFHLLVMLAANDVKLEDLVLELKKRRG